MCLSTFNREDENRAVRKCVPADRDEGLNFCRVFTTRNALYDMPKLQRHGSLLLRWSHQEAQKLDLSEMPILGAGNVENRVKEAFGVRAEV